MLRPSQPKHRYSNAKVCRLLYIKTLSLIYFAATLESEDDSDDSSDDGRTPMRFKSYAPSGKQKRTRTMSPGAALRELKQRRAVRGKKRQEEKAARAQKRAEARQNALLEALMAEHPGSRSNDGSYNGQIIFTSCMESFLTYSIIRCFWLFYLTFIRTANARSSHG